MQEKSAKKKTTLRNGNPEGFEAQKGQLIKQRADFITRKTSKSAKIITENRVYVFAEQELTPTFGEAMYFLKQEILSNADKVEKAPYSSNIYDINYFDFSKSVHTMTESAGEVVELKNVWEADITAAYYRAALNMGFISQRTYDMCLRLKKHDRLRLMGSIATRAFTEEYHQGSLTHAEIKANELLRSAWFKVCSYVDMAMKTLKEILGELFLFYWVDGIYFYGGKNMPKRGKPEDLLFWEKKLGEKFHFEWKLVKLTKFRIINKDTYCEIELWKEGAEKPKLFYPKREAIKGYYFARAEDFLCDMPAKQASYEHKRREEKKRIALTGK